MLSIQGKIYLAFSIFYVFTIYYAFKILTKISNDVALIAKVKNETVKPVNKRIKK
jgi:hypothetical protein